MISTTARSALLTVALVAASCVPPQPQGELWVENRGGPDLVLEVAGAHAVSVRCNGGASLVPGADGMPQLPWHLRVRRAGDGRVVLDEVVAELPRWFVQIGDEVLTPNLSSTVILGPGGPPCP
jgi:hypothetical protein